ncbi:uncharacterized protein LOC117125108 [Anneissia japonica]|uniref:uncharacterized protein LOC117125108 n=1 Tax=Anneissia japonica TaxID=1529436 RepID=UPI001425633D|nr:uncharacterized protein LOC117125108 [Anneissia japonica]
MHHQFEKPAMRHQSPYHSAYPFWNTQKIIKSQQSPFMDIKTGINLWKLEISKLIFQLVEKHCNKQERERVRAWINDPDTIPTRGFTVAVTLIALAVDNPLYSMICLGKSGQYRIPFLPIVKNLIIRQVSLSEKEKIAGEYIRDLFKDATYKDDLKELYKKWKKARTDTIQMLEYIADEMSDDRKNANIAKVVGSSVSAVGTAAAVGATALAIVIPGGIAAAGAIAAIGSAAGIAGGATNIGADIVADKLAKRAETKCEKIIRNEAKCTEDFVKLLNEYKKHTENHLKTAKMLGDVLVRFRKLHETRVRITFGIGDSVEEDLGFVKSVVKETKLIEGKKKTIVKIVTIGGEVITRVIHGTGVTVATKIALNMSDDVARLFTYAAAKAARVVAGVVVIGIDIYSIVKTAIELDKGSPDKAAENIRKAVKELKRRALPELEDVIIQTRLEAAEKDGIEEVLEN